MYILKQLVNQRMGIIRRSLETGRLYGIEAAQEVADAIERDTLLRPAADGDELLQVVNLSQALEDHPELAAPGFSFDDFTTFLDYFKNAGILHYVLRKLAA